MSEQKWIINDGNLIIGNVEIHDELHSGKMDRNKTIGGGKWLIDKKNNIMYFFGRSIDYGQVTKEEFEKSHKQPSIDKYTIYFSLKSSPCKE